MTKKALTQKKIKFCHAYIETGNASQAYLDSHNVRTTNKKTITNKANALKNEECIKEYIQELQSDARESHGVTVESILVELEEARQMAIRTGQAGAMSTASMGKAKILGLGKEVVEHKGDLTNLQPVIIVGDGDE